VVGILLSISWLSWLQLEQLSVHKAYHPIEAPFAQLFQQQVGYPPPPPPNNHNPSARAPKTKLTVHFYGHGAKLYENSIVMRELVLLCPSMQRWAFVDDDRRFKRVHSWSRGHGVPLLSRSTALRLARELRSSLAREIFY
jgi:hypothetical protein